ncbi:MAG: YigZ family protein [Syntrophomonadaceae bacterium]|jgi:uncharacterized YigZ family protein|nr:YigZ family protein [Syntrophomonadaceae bacterium]
MQEYLTVQSLSESAIVVKKSRFIAILCPVNNEMELSSCLDKARVLYPRATHYCYAGIFKDPVIIERFSDDNEPSGTAGKPILSVLRGAKLVNAAAVVIRYFGGTLLGAGGLVKAYTEAVQQTLSRTEIVRMVPSEKLLIKMEYSAYNQFMSKLQTFIIGTADTQFTDNVSIQLHVAVAAAEDFKHKLREICHAQYTETEKKYLPVKML